MDAVLRIIDHGEGHFRCLSDTITVFGSNRLQRRNVQLFAFDRWKGKTDNLRDGLICRSGDYLDICSPTEDVVVHVYLSVKWLRIFFW